MKKEEKKTIAVETMKVSEYDITIVGDTPLIVHAWSEKAKKEMLGKQTKETKTKGHAIREPWREFVDGLYWITEKPEMNSIEDFYDACEKGAKFGFPVVAVKKSAQSSAYRVGAEKNKMGLRGAFFIDSIGDDLLGEIITDEAPEMREDMVKIGGISKVSDLRYRPMFRNWKMKLHIKLNENAGYTIEQIVNYINMAGFMNGIGEWRAEKDGQFGMFHVE